MAHRLREIFSNILGWFAAALSHRRRALLASIFITALIIRLAFSTVLGGLGRSPNYDEIRYNNFAVGMLQGQGYSTEYGPTASKPPLFPFFLTGVYFLFGSGDVTSARIILALIDSISCLLIFTLGNKLVNPFVGFFAALGAAFYPLFLFMSSQIYPETLFMVVLLVALILTIEMVRRRNLLYALLGGFFFGCCVLIRPNILVFGIFIAIYPFL
jgi:4-amino-4-deoxy-L-arabinose transferase-like glycosyltransferase